MPAYVEKLGRVLARMKRPPRFIAGHRVTGLRGSDGATEWDEPDAVWGEGRHYPVRGKVQDVREIPEGYAADLTAIDAERARLKDRLAELRRQEEEILKAAWPAARPLTLAEVKAMS